jgi:hypothetical protein
MGLIEGILDYALLRMGAFNRIESIRTMDLWSLFVNQGTYRRATGFNQE